MLLGNRAHEIVSVDVVALERQNFEVKLLGRREPARAMVRRGVTQQCRSLSGALGHFTAPGHWFYSPVGQSDCSLRLAAALDFGPTA